MSIAKIAGLAAALCVAVPGAANASSTRLLCQTYLMGQRLSIVLNVDFDARTVDGTPARFTDDLITYETPYVNPNTHEKTVMTHELNRIDGSYWQAQRDGVYAAPPPRYSCAPATKNVF